MRQIWVCTSTFLSSCSPKLPYPSNMVFRENDWNCHFLTQHIFLAEMHSIITACSAVGKRKKIHTYHFYQTVLLLPFQKNSTRAGWSSDLLSGRIREMLTRIKRRHSTYTSFVTDDHMRDLEGICLQHSILWCTAVFWDQMFNGYLVKHGHL